MNIPGIGGPPGPGTEPTDFAFVWKLDGPRFGGAIMAARGSFAAAAGAPGPAAAGDEEAGPDTACGVVGGGPIGFAFSWGSSPGNTHLRRP